MQGETWPVRAATTTWLRSLKQKESVLIYDLPEERAMVTYSSA